MKKLIAVFCVVLLSATCPAAEKSATALPRSRPEALAQLRAPLFEDKVIDFIVEMAKVTDKPVSPTELLSDGSGEEEPAKSDNG